MRLDKAFNRWAVMRSLEDGMEEVSIITVVFGGREMAFSMSWRAAEWILCREMEDKTVLVRREE
jgi:hypothetical protein